MWKARSWQKWRREIGADLVRPAGRDVASGRPLDSQWAVSGRPVGSHTRWTVVAAGPRTGPPLRTTLLRRSRAQTGRRERNLGRDGRPLLAGRRGDNLAALALWRCGHNGVWSACVWPAHNAAVGPRTQSVAAQCTCTQSALCAHFVCVLCAFCVRFVCVLCAFRTLHFAHSSLHTAHKAHSKQRTLHTVATGHKLDTNWTQTGHRLDTVDHPRRQTGHAYLHLPPVAF